MYDWSRLPLISRVMWCVWRCAILGQNTILVIHSKDCNSDRTHSHLARSGVQGLQTSHVKKITLLKVDGRRRINNLV